MIVLGITGGIATGKTTVSRMFADAGFPVFDADAAVHAIYAAPPASVATVIPAAMVEGKIDRRLAASLIAADPALLDRIEAAVHPFVRAKAAAFLAEARLGGSPIAILEVPLLFESGLDALCDRVLVTTVAPATAAARAAARGMSDALYRRLTERQMSADEKTARADYVVDSGEAPDAMRRRVEAIMADLVAAERDRAGA